ncbi:hypothetical protein RB195_010452 [Necator americanus]|uniref:Integrase catalytic domain-containing protein n=1 Tax=Necator americanus TaxID=51031 RepID=A0ABR1CYE6_NECAM
MSESDILCIAYENDTGFQNYELKRLIRLDLVPGVSAVAFLKMLRRFFARRDAPQTITSDNAITFALGDVVLLGCFETAGNDPTWQGGVYERLIRSVKLEMYKSLGKMTRSKEQLGTLIIEIKGMLNTRPLNKFEIPSLLQSGDAQVDDPD